MKFHTLSTGGTVRTELTRASGGAPGETIRVRVVDHADTSERHRVYPDGYDHRCGWCRIGRNHSEAAHTIWATTGSPPRCPPPPAPRRT